MLENNVLDLASGATYSTVIKFSVHAHPAVAPYPHEKEYLAPIKQGGVIEYIYRVVKCVEDIDTKTLVPCSFTTLIHCIIFS